MAQYGPQEWFYATGELAANQRAAVFGPGDSNAFAPIFSDAGLTVPMANPTITDGTGQLTFYAADGTYWIFVGPVGTGDSVMIDLGAVPGAVDSVNGQTGTVVLDAADVGAQPIGTIDAKGDLYVGTGPDATDRLAVGADGLVLTTDSVEATGLKWAAGGGGGAVTSVNSQTGAVVLTATDVGADVAGAAAAAAAASQPIGTINAKGDLYAGTANDATTRQGVGTNGQVLTADSTQSTGMKWATPASAPVTSVNSQTGAVVLGAADVGADVAGAAAAAAAASQPLATIDAKGDLYAGTADNATARRSVGTNGQVLTADSAQATGLSWTTPTPAPVTSVNSQTGAVVLTSANVGAQPIATVTAKGDLYVATASATVTRRPVGTDGQVLTADSVQADGVKWATPVSAPVTSVNTQTGAVVLTAADVGADASGAAAAVLATSAQKAANLSDLTSATTARGNLGLGGAAVLGVGTTAGTVAAGDDSRIVGAQQRSTVTAKGDLYAATASATVARQPVGTNGQVLTADSAQATGLSWVTPTAAPVTSVNSQTGAVVLNAASVGADAAGAAAAAQAASQPLDSDLTAIAALSPPDDDIIQRKSGIWVARTMAQVKTDLAITPADIGAVPTSRTLTAGTAMSGGGDLSADRTFNVVLGTSGASAAAGNDSRITGAQQLSTLTTKGDLYVATASATSARQGVGTNGQVLTADSAQTNGLKWADPAAAGVVSGGMVPRSTGYIPTGGVVTARSSKTATLNAMYLMPFVLLSGATLSSIAFEVTANIATAVARLGIYASSASNLPTGAAVADYGTTAADTTGTKTAAVSTVLAAGLYWLAFVGQTAAPTVRQCTGWTPYVASATFPAGSGVGWDNCYVQTSVTGALPSIGTIVDSDGPMCGIKF